MNNRKLNIFAYGSLLWRPGFSYLTSEVGTIAGWERRFWQGSPDHRGTPEAPGRVVTLVPERERICTGRIYTLSAAEAPAVLAYLDDRESGGYSRLWVSVTLTDGKICRALTYAALSGNAHYLGSASDAKVREQLESSHGPSGANIDYWKQLNQALAELPCDPEELRTTTLRSITESG